MVQGWRRCVSCFIPARKYEIRDKYRTVFTPGKLRWSGRFMSVKWVTKMHWFGPYLQMEIIHSVKSAYRLLATEVTNGLPPSSDGDYSLTWKRIWKIQAHELLCTTYLRPAWCFDWSWSVLENWWHWSLFTLLFIVGYFYQIHNIAIMVCLVLYFGLWLNLFLFLI